MIRVLSIPASHSYVRHAVGDVVTQVDPGSLEPHPTGSRHPAFDPDWISRYRREFDVVHVHFGFEGCTVAALRDWTAELARLRVPLVVTVHDLELPHEQDQRAHTARLQVLLHAAGSVVTLTAGAAEELHRRGVIPLVLPHPQMVTTDEIRGAWRQPRQQCVVGLHLKSLRRNAGGAALVKALVHATAESSASHSVTLQLTAHRELQEAASRTDSDTRTRAVVRSLQQAEQHRHVDLRWVERFSDSRFSRYLRELDVSVLPQRWGTHSGWLEQCRDLGVVPVIPAVGRLTEQAASGPARRPCSYSWGALGPDPTSLRAALDLALQQVSQGWTARQAETWAHHRDATRAASQQAHLAMYRQVLNHHTRVDGTRLPAVQLSAGAT